MERIDQLAELSVGRGCGFAALLIGTLMVGLSSDTVLASRASGTLCLLASMILILKANLSERRQYQRTEVWMMLEAGDRPAPEIAGRLVSAALRHWHLYFAMHAAGLAAALLALSLVLSALLQ